MNRIIILSLILIAGNSLSAYSQVQVISPELQRFYDDYKHLQKFNESAEANYDGSPYLNKEFEPGKIILSNGNEYKDIMLRYNVYNDEFEFSNDNKVLALEKDPQFSAFIIAEKEFYYKKYFLKEKPKEGYLLKLVEGKYSLYLKYNVVLREAEEPKPFQEARKPNFVIQKPSYMIGSEREGIIVIKNLKDFYKYYQDLKGIVKDFAGREKIKLKSEQDYIDLVNFLNSQSQQQNK